MFFRKLIADEETITMKMGFTGVFEEYRKVSVGERSVALFCWDRWPLHKRPGEVILEAFEDFGKDMVESRKMNRINPQIEFFIRMTNQTRLFYLTLIGSCVVWPLVAHASVHNHYEEIDLRNCCLLEEITIQISVRAHTTLQQPITGNLERRKAESQHFPISEYADSNRYFKL